MSERGRETGGNRETKSSPLPSFSVFRFPFPGWGLQ
jgi:hypothetical protein